MIERDFKLRALVPLHGVNVRNGLYGSDSPSKAPPTQITTDGLRPVALAFFRNMSRLDDTSLVLPMLVYMAEHLGKHGSIAIGYGNISAGVVATGGEVSETMIARRWKTVPEYLDATPNLKNGIHDALGRIQTWSPLGDSAIDSWLASIVTDCWTMFEVLATDLWEEALNCHPHGLTNMGDKKVSIRQLQEYGYDLRGSMGTLLKDKLGARGLKDIRDGYEDAFSENRANIDKAICDESLLVLQSVRNSLVHRAGIVDQRFCDQVKGCKLTALSSLKSGERILLDGELVRGLVGPAVQCSLDLLLAVDRWLQCH